MFFPKQKHPLRVLLKSDETMFLPQAKAMHLRRDVCLWHVADKKCYCEWKQGYPASTQYPAGTPITPRNDIECFARVIKVFPKIKAPFWVLLITRRKRREFDDFLGFFAGSENPSVRVAHFVFEITLSQAITLTLLLVCAFSPRVHSIPRGPRLRSH